MIEKMSYGEKILLLVLFFGLIMLIQPFKQPTVDQVLIGQWGETMLKNGIPGMYRNVAWNYGPVVTYLLGVWSMFIGVSDQIIPSMVYFKAVVGLFDLGLLAIVLRLFERFRIPTLSVFYLALNPILLYDAFLWGQIDIIHSMFAFTAILMLLLRKPTLAGVFLILSLNTKPFGIIYLPIFALILLPLVARRWRVLGRMAVAMGGCNSF